MLNHALRSLVLGGLVALAYPTNLHAERFDTAASLRAGQLSLGIEGQLAGTSDHYGLLNLHEAVGLSPGFDLTFRQAFDFEGNRRVFDGALKWTITSGIPGFAIWTGLRYDQSLAFNIAVMLDVLIRPARVYLGLDATFNNRATVAGLLGVRFYLAKRWAWFVEAGIRLVGYQDRYYVSTGPKLILF